MRAPAPDVAGPSVSAADEGEVGEDGHAGVEDGQEHRRLPDGRCGTVIGPPAGCQPSTRTRQATALPQSGDSAHASRSVRRWLAEYLYRTQRLAARRGSGRPIQPALPVVNWQWIRTAGRSVRSSWRGACSEDDRAPDR